MSRKQAPPTPDDAGNRSFWTSLPGVLTGIAAVLAAVATIYQISHSPAKPNGPDPPPAHGVSAENWGGAWVCRTTDHEMALTVTGHGAASALKGYYAHAWGGQPAREDYTIRDLQPDQASGDYLYFDANPNVGYDGRQGVFKGTWVATFGERGFRLVRLDTTSGWRGEYECVRSGAGL